MRLAIVSFGIIFVKKFALWNKIRFIFQSLRILLTFHFIIKSDFFLSKSVSNILICESAMFLWFTHEGLRVR
jgi:hypothetical protein